VSKHLLGTSCGQDLSCGKHRNANRVPKAVQGSSDGEQKTNYLAYLDEKMKSVITSKDLNFIVNLTVTGTQVDPISYKTGYTNLGGIRVPTFDENIPLIADGQSHVIHYNGNPWAEDGWYSLQHQKQLVKESD
jgi:hypothetical protein